MSLCSSIAKTQWKGTVCDCFDCFLLVSAINVFLHYKVYDLAYYNFIAQCTLY